MIGRRRIAIGWATLAGLVLLWFALTTFTGTTVLKLKDGKILDYA